MSQINKNVFISTFKDILDGPDFKCFNINHKTILVNYVEHFWNQNERLKKIFENVIFIIQKNINVSIDDMFENFSKELANDKNTVTYF